ncbi:c-type cytochrome [Verrucomicrobiales bacterium]|nr:c-type cytochrome [Verrucomicrobiales bacterium]
MKLKISLFLPAIAVTTASSEPAHDLVPADLFTVPEGLEVTVWATSPMLYNPTNMDVDKDGRIWVAEGVNYRKHAGRREEGDRIQVLEDTDRDGKADKSWTFVQEPGLAAPLGVAVFDNKIVVSHAPDMIVYTDVDRDMKFDPAIDTREVLLTGFEGAQHDHSIHSVTAGPGGQWYWSQGNCGAQFTDRSGEHFRIGSSYYKKEYAGETSDDGHVYVGGFAARMNPDGTAVNIVGHNFRNSYEHCVTSFGDVFQNDNDDPPACRVSHILEYGNAGFSSADGKRVWGMDRRFGQDIPTAEWRQDDPGTMPAGDIYGGGSPTGVAFYENGALGKKWEGLLLSCEAGRNVVFGYQPELEGAGFKLDRTNFITSNTTGEFVGTDFKDAGTTTNEKHQLFRPSDILVGPDGALYVSDWFDARVGGHDDRDDSLSGTIYRVAPKGFKPDVPEIDYTTSAGQLAALKSPAINVRHPGFTALLAKGKTAVPEVAPLLDHPNHFIRARAIWLLANLGQEGATKVEAILASDDVMLRTAAFRALRRTSGDLIGLAKKMVSDPSAAIRREVALAMRNESGAEVVEILKRVADKFDGEDRSYLEALGTGATNKEAAVFAALGLGQGDPLAWSPAQARLAWRLMTPAAVPGLAARASSENLDGAQRKLALDGLAFIKDPSASNAMLDVAAETTGKIREDALWWLTNRSGNDWSSFGVLAAMKARGLGDTEEAELVSIEIPAPSKDATRLPAAAEIAKLTGDPAAGKVLASRCIMCHEIDGAGVGYGPVLTDFGKTQPTEVIIQAITEPSHTISHGFEGTSLKTKDGKTIHGILLSESDPLVIKSTGGLVQRVSKDNLKSRSELGYSLMLSAVQLGMTAQDVADITAYLKQLGTEKTTASER